MSLVGFGGAAGQHLCRVAAALGIQHILDHPNASVLSAVGMGLASVGRVVTRGVYRPFDTVSEDEIQRLAEELSSETVEQLASEQLGDRQPKLAFECDVRYLGTEVIAGADA